MVKNFHACATCSHFQSIKAQEGMIYRCKRLGFKTQPQYKFDCWEPKEHIVKLMKKESGGQSI